MVTLGHYLIVSGMLFTIGFAGVLLRRNIIIIFMSLELMLNAANLSLVAFSRFRVVDGLPNYNAQVFVFFIITVAAAEVAVGLAIIVALFRARQTVHVEDINSLKFSSMDPSVAWFILLNPLIAAAAIHLLCRKAPSTATFISVLSSVLGLVAAIAAFSWRGGHAPAPVFEVPWIDFGSALRVPIGLQIDDLSKVMLRVVCGIGAAVHMY